MKAAPLFPGVPSPWSFIGQERPYSEFMPYSGVYEALDAVARRFPDRRALCFIVSADPRVAPIGWTQAQFIAQVRRAANLFSTLAAGEVPRVAMLLPSVPQAYFSLFGAEAAGVACPINYLLDERSVADLIRASRANILVALGPHPELDIWSRVPGIVRDCPGLAHVLAVGGAYRFADFQASCDRMPGDALGFERDVSAATLAALFHTGGTTGAPKLAQHTHGNQLHAAWGAASMYAMSERDIVINAFPLFHVAGAFVYGLSALLSGAELVLPTTLGMRNLEFVRHFWQFVERHRITLLTAVPTVLATLLGTDPGEFDRNSVRAALTGGSPLPVELAGAFERKFGIALRNILGMTECAGVVSIEAFDAPRVPGSCGLALPFTEVKAVSDGGEDCAPGEAGILRLRGPNVGPGYTDPARNEGTFTADGWLVTGDIGHVDEVGRVFVTGRAKDVIIRSGHNIDPQMIEEALLGHPAVSVAAAVGEPDEYAGELPVVFAALKPGAVVDGDELKRYADAHIAERPAYPRRVDIVASLPTTAIGKVYRPALRAIATERALCERVARAGLDADVEVSALDTSAGIRVRFALAPGAESRGVRESIDALMQPFAIAFEVVPEGDARSATGRWGKPQ